MAAPEIHFHSPQLHDCPTSHFAPLFLQSAIHSKPYYAPSATLDENEPSHSRCKLCVKVRWSIYRLAMLLTECRGSAVPTVQIIVEEGSKLQSFLLYTEISLCRAQASLQRLREATQLLILRALFPGLKAIIAAASGEKVTQVLSNCPRKRLISLRYKST